MAIGRRQPMALANIPVCVIDPEFQALCPPLNDEELAQLTANLLADGCRDPLVVWETAGQALLLDGHNRLAICQAHDLPFTTQNQACASRNEARTWIIN